jgi:hypothetical protein
MHSLECLAAQTVSNTTLHSVWYIHWTVTQQLHLFVLDFLLYTPLLCHTVTKTYKFCHLLTLTELNVCNCENVNRTSSVNVTYCWCELCNCRCELCDCWCELCDCWCELCDCRCELCDCWCELCDCWSAETAVIVKYYGYVWCSARNRLQYLLIAVFLVFFCFVFLKVLKT